MITNIINGMTVYRPRQTPTGLYYDTYKVSEMTGRKLELITVVPAFVANKPKSPYYCSQQIPAKDLIDEQELLTLLQSCKQLHPAMTV